MEIYFQDLNLKSINKIREKKIGMEVKNKSFRKKYISMVKEWTGSILPFLENCFVLFFPLVLEIGGEFMPDGK